MDYRKIYNALIQKRKEKRLSRKECYCEKHHIIPRSIGGTDEEVNLVLLTAREHSLAHKILVRILAFEKGIDSKEYEKMVYALWYMSHKSCFPDLDVPTIKPTLWNGMIRSSKSQFLAQSFFISKDFEVVYDSKFSELQCSTK